MNSKTSSASAVTLFFHWSVTLVVIGMLSLGFYMSRETAFLYPIHKSIGFLALFLIAARLVWRLVEGRLVPVAEHKAHERFLATITHWFLLIATLLMPVSGVVMSVAGGRGLQLFGLELVAANISPVDPSKVLALNEFLAGVAHETHEYLPYVLIAAIVLHIVGALKHHVIDKDATLNRMLGKQ